MPTTISPWQSAPSAPFQFPNYGGPSTPPSPVSAPGSTGPLVAGQAQAAGQSAAAGQLPGYGGSLANIGGNIAAETAGQLPADVITQIQQQAAERGVATGAPGSDNSNAAMLRALGLTSLNLTQQGQQNFQSILPSLPGYSLSQNPAFYTTPGEALSANIANSNLQGDQQALAEAKSGVAKGLGLGGTGGGGVTLPGARTPGTDAFGFPDGSLTITPAGAGGGYQTDTPYGAFNPQNPPPPLNQSDVDKILQMYAGGGTAASNIDPETGLPTTGGGADNTDMFDYFYGGDDSSGE